MQLNSVSRNLVDLTTELSGPGKTEPARKSLKKGLTFTHAGNRKDLGK